MAVSVPPPPYMLGERPTPLHGGSGAPTFRQVPFVRVSERVESGVKVRKELRKYLKAASATQHMVAQMHLSDACVTAMQPQEVAQSCFAKFFDQMKRYNQVLGQKHLEASKAYLEMTRPLDNSGRSRKWARDVYNLVQKSVQDVALADKKMDKARQRKERAEEELAHWRNVLDANEATYQVQPGSPEVIRAYQLAQYRFSSAFMEDEAATNEFDDARAMLYASVSRRDEVVEEATELSQSIEEDRMDTMLIVINQFVETKVAILQAEIEAMTGLRQFLKEMDRESVVQQYIVDSMQPELTHRHAKALYILEWHRVWHQEQRALEATEPMSYLALGSPEDIVKVKAGGISANDVEIIKDFIASCFVDPDPLLIAVADKSSGKGDGADGMAPGSSTSSASISTKHRNRFTDASALGMYRIAIVRRVVVSCLNHQRARSLELSREGYTQLATTIRLLLDACSEKQDTKTIKNLMNMMQTFYRFVPASPSSGSGVSANEDSKRGKKKEYLHAVLTSHPAWSVPEYWGNALLLSLGEELSKNAQEVPWYFLPAAERAQLVLHVHNVVYGQVTAFVYHLVSFGYSRKQLLQYVQNVCFAYELGEEQRISLLSAVQSVQIDEALAPRCVAASTAAETPEGGSSSTTEVQFSSFTLPDWSSLPSGASGGSGSQRFRPFARSRGPSAADSTVSELLPLTRSSSRSAVSASGRDLEEMKSIVSNSMAATLAAGEESWEDLFGSRANSDGGGMATIESDDGSGEKSKKEKKKAKNSRKFNDQLRLARSMTLSQRIHEDVPLGPGGAVPSPSKPPKPSTLLRPHSSHNILMRPEPILEVEADERSRRLARSRSEKEPRSARSESQLDYNLQQPLVERRRKKRVIKSRSAASIDTSHLAADPQEDVDAPPNSSPIPPSHYEIVAASSASSGRRAAPSSFSSSTTSLSLTPAPTGMDQIKSIAAQMKQRRKSPDVGSVAKPPPMDASAKRAGGDAESPQSQQENIAPVSGVAALRARFEKR
jgi:hypothetical protein